MSTTYKIKDVYNDKFVTENNKEFLFNRLLSDNEVELIKKEKMSILEFYNLVSHDGKYSKEYIKNAKTQENS